MPTLVDCPQSDQGEWRFDLFGIAVRVKWWFWLACLVTCYGRQTTSEIVIWIVVVFASILVHEMGHVMAFRPFGVGSDIVLYGWGGLTIPFHTLRRPLQRLVVSLAGPMAGFCLAAATFGVAVASGADVHFGWRSLLPFVIALPHAGLAASGNASFIWYVFLNTLLTVNLYWGLVNLLPIFPLDGGQSAMALLERSDPSGGRRKAFILSIATAIVMAGVGILEGDGYMVIVFAVLAVASLQALESESHRPYRSPRW